MALFDDQHPLATLQRMARCPKPKDTGTDRQQIRMIAAAISRLNPRLIRCMNVLTHPASE